jgi:recombination protein RecR
MKKLPVPALETLVNEFSKLPGIGQKTAQRLAIFILKGEASYAKSLSAAIATIKTTVVLCNKCFNISEQDVCEICSDPTRDINKICVVEDIVDILAIEDTNVYQGLYHVLGGVISPLAGVLPSDLKVKELVERVREMQTVELIMALPPSTEGEATMIYLSKQFTNMDVNVTRVASGIPVGSQLEFLDKETIGRALQSRRVL